MTLKSTILVSPESHLDSSVKPLIENWDEEPTSLQVLEVLDKCVYGGLASGMMIQLFNSIYDSALVKEGKVHNDNVPIAAWRVKGTTCEIH